MRIYPLSFTIKKPFFWKNETNYHNSGGESPPDFSGRRGKPPSLIQNPALPPSDPPMSYTMGGGNNAEKYP